MKASPLTPYTSMPATAPAIAQDHDRLSGRAKARTSKLTLPQVEAIRRYAAEHTTVGKQELCVSLASDYGVAATTIEDVLTYTTWRTEQHRQALCVSYGLPVTRAVPKPAVISPARKAEIDRQQVALLVQALGRPLCSAESAGRVSR